MAGDWRELLQRIKDSRQRVRAANFDSPPGDHGEAMRRYGLDQTYDVVEEIVRSFSTEKDSDDDGDKEDNPADED